MKKTQKRAFILNECKSPYIEQVIFILKDGVSSENRNVIADAEQIVATYMGNTVCLNRKKSTKPLLATIISIFGIISLSVCMYFIMR